MAVHESGHGEQYRPWMKKRVSQKGRPTLSEEDEPARAATRERCLAVQTMEKSSRLLFLALFEGGKPFVHGNTSPSINTMLKPEAVSSV